jgi:serine/threonine protein kinase
MYKSADTQIGRFELIRELGRGLKSVVYLANDPEIQRPVAIKVISGDGSVYQELTDRTAAVSGLSHIGILKIYDLGRTENGEPYVISEYIEGTSLEAVLVHRKFKVDQALQLTLELLDVLEYAHARGVQHHNLKPTNLILTPENHLKVTDFAGTRSSTATAFLAPERLKGIGDERSDLFSVGVILYLLLSGHRPFQGNTDATIGFKLVHQHPVPVAAMDLELSPELDHVIGRLLAKNPDERYQSAAEAKADIRNIQSGEGPASPREIPVDVLDGISFRRNGRSVLAEKDKSEKKFKFRLSKLALPAVIALVLATIFLALRPLLKPLPATPSLATHIGVPEFAFETRASQPSPRRPAKKKPAGTAAVSAKSAGVSRVTTAHQMVAVPVELRQPFEQCLMSIWIDDRLAYSNVIRSEKKKRFLGIGAANQGYLTMIQAPAGEHSIRVEIKADRDKFEETTELQTLFAEMSGKKLEIKCEKTPRLLKVEMN